ncbi:hypothetical protein VE03_06846 [Pseudogymnoascus sp. 23342-1-I1]|nr:hypothetical protein VE03_06846 [Pseudogymnoascus sp. 23342-1-I1]
MPVTRSEKRLRATSEQSELPSNNLSQTSELKLSNSTSRPKRSKKLPPSSGVSSINNSSDTTGLKSDKSFTAPTEESRRRSLRSSVTSSNKPDVVHTPELKLGKSLSRSEKRTEKRRLQKLQLRSEASSNNSIDAASALTTGLGSYSLPEPRVRNLRSHSSVSSSKNNTPTPAPQLDMRSYSKQDMGSNEFRYTSYESSAGKIALPNLLDEMSYTPRGDMGMGKHRSDSTRSLSKMGDRSPSPASDMRFASAQQDLSRPNKKPRFFVTASENDNQTPESSAGTTSSRIKLSFKTSNSNSKLSEGNFAPSSNDIPTPASEDLSSPLSGELSSPLSESKSAPSAEENIISRFATGVSPLSTSNSASYSEYSVAPVLKSNSAPSPEPQSKKRAAPHPEPSATSTPKSNRTNTPRKKARGDTTPTEELTPEKQSQYRAERDRERSRVAEQQKLLLTMEDFREGFRELLSHIRAPRKNSHNKKNFNEHMFALKLHPDLCLMEPSKRHKGIFVKDVCFESTSEAMITWVMGYLMEVVQSDCLAWGGVVVELPEGSPLGKVSNWGVNPECQHQLETCFINTNVEILLCRKTFSVTVTYHRQWKCAGEYDVPSGDMTHHTATGGGISSSMGAGGSGYGPVLHSPPTGPSFSHAPAPAFAPGADTYTAGGRQMMPFLPSLADYLPANPYLSPYRAPAPPPPQPAYGGDFPGSSEFQFDESLLSNPAFLVDPALPTPPFQEHQHFALPAFEAPPHDPSSSALHTPYQWVQPPTPSYLDAWTTPSYPSPPNQEAEFTYPDPDVATGAYVANWVGAKLNLPLEPERGGVCVAPPAPVQPVVVAGPKKRVRRSRAKAKKGAAVDAGATASSGPVPAAPATAAPWAAMEMNPAPASAPAPEPAVLGLTPAQTLAALQSAARVSPGVPVLEEYRHIWFLNGRGRVSKTRDNNPRCQRCRRRHWASCSRGRPCDECAKDSAPCVYGPGLGEE